MGDPELEIANHHLRERVKELTALHAAARILDDDALDLADARRRAKGPS